MKGVARHLTSWSALIALTVPVTALMLWLHAPAALMLGPLLSGIVFASWGGKVNYPVPVFGVAQGIVGSMIAMMVPLTIVGDILGHWALFTVGVVAVVAASTWVGWQMTRWQMLPGTTALWGVSPGAASVMTYMAEAYGADMRMVAFMQYLRVVMVAVVAAAVARYFGGASQHAPAAIVWFPEVAWLPLLETLALAGVGAWLARRLSIPAGAFLLPLVGGIVLTHLGWLRLELPTWLLAGCYALVGWNVGLRFTRALLVHVLHQLPGILLCIFAMLALCGAVAAFMVFAAGIDPLTAYLATSPGGADSIAIIAASTDVDVSFVMAMQTVRLLVVLFVAPYLTRIIADRIGDLGKG
ncbi:AbrB family transcriptional regulator [Reyranella sp.]|uniref:AbrB family transcriptional regulator n=1 Tax=Reyranella sp. TaxID=1929291 RepID=UPI00271A7464|nr:AbrB family transcriptional regulator [Reyranella sp.]MDO8973295.1 AbrB family transcriptional regulator [Reyranella sp.]